MIGLFGTGRRYINELMLKNIGERAKYFRDTIRLHPGPTPMIYSGHATIRHVSRGQESPEVMSRILEAVRCGICRFDFCLSPPPRLVADKLGLVADVHSRKQGDFRYLAGL